MVGRHRKNGRQEGIKEVNSQEKGQGDSPDKQRFLSLLAEPGCLLCREERKAEDRFFVWYVIEKYSEVAELLGLRSKARPF